MSYFTVFRNEEPATSGNYCGVPEPPEYVCEGDKFNERYCVGCDNYEECKSMADAEADNDD